MNWHLDVTFREDANTTLDKQTAQNQNTIRKWSLSILKTIELMKLKIPIIQVREGTVFMRLLWQHCKNGLQCCRDSL